MKKLFLLMAAIGFAIATSAANENETTVLRIKGMRCEDCAHKVTTVLNKLPGVEGMSFDLEKRTVTVEYDPALTSTDSIKARLAATGRYKSSPYDASEVIRRGLGLKMSDMHCQKCADRITQRLTGMEGIDSLSPHLDKQYLFVRYDANRTCKDNIRKALGELGFTPVNYYTSNDIGFAYYQIPKEQCTEATVEEVLILDGVDDANVNPRQGSLAITYVNTETSAEKLLEAVQAAGIKATVPPTHECKENK